MTNRSDRWKRRALFALFFMLLVLSGLAGCTYGVIWFTARTEVDKEARMVALEDVTISKADFPTALDGGAAYLTALRQIVSAQPLTVALDRLQAELETERVEDPSRIVQVKNDPQRIIVSQGPALLVRIDGQPVLRE